MLNRIKLYIGALRPAFLTASIMPVLAGSSLGFAVTGEFHWGLFFLAIFAVVFIHSGCNICNDYFDHKSGADAANKNPTDFSGGSRFIQKGLMSPKATLIETVILLSSGSLLGVIIVFITKSLFILVLGLAGVILGALYTAPPVKFCYRTLGEIVIALLFGILPVAGSYYIQTKSVDLIVVVPAVIIAILVFLIILINEFPDVGPDSQSNKKTLVVRFGISSGVIIYRAALVLSYMIAAVSIFADSKLIYACIFYLFTIPLAVFNFRLANTQELTEPKRFIINARTILLHTLGSLALTAGFITAGLFG